MIGGQRVGFGPIEIAECVDLVFQDLKHQSRVEFWIIHMSRLQTAIMVVLDEVVVWVARKGQRVEPQSVDRRAEELRQARSRCGEVGQIMAQDIVTDQMMGADHRRF